MRTIHQLLAGGTLGNAVVAEALAIEQAMREWGYAARTYAADLHPSLLGKVAPLEHLRITPEDIFILHLTTDSDATKICLAMPHPLVVIYHNITPPSFLRGLGNGLSKHSRDGRASLSQLAKRATLTIAHSVYSVNELKQVGFKNTQVLPVVIPHDLDLIKMRNESNRSQHKYDTALLHVGRVVPNKRIEDVIKVYYYYHKINPSSQLVLVGSSAGAQAYCDWLNRFISSLGLDGVHLVGQRSDSELAEYYHNADVYITMSEHEGFNVPLVESMRFGVPIVAYASSAIPETLGSSGVLVQHKDYGAIAGMIHQLHTHPGLRARVVAGQIERAKAFEPAIVLSQLRQVLEPVLKS